MSVPDSSSGSGPCFQIEFLTDVVGLRLTGEADLCGEDNLRAAIDALPRYAGAIHLELAGLRFIDVGNAGLLVALTRRPARPRLVLHCPPPTLIKMISHLWPESLSRFVIATERDLPQPPGWLQPAADGTRWYDIPLEPGS